MTFLDGIGELHVDPDIDEWLVTQPLDTPFLDRSIEYVIDWMEPADEADVARCINAFRGMDPQSARVEAAPHLFAYYRDFVALVGAEGMPEIAGPEEIWDHVSALSHGDTPHVVKEDDGFYIVLDGGCDWDEEHGVILSYRGGSELARVGMYDGQAVNSDGEIYSPMGR